MLAAWQHLGSLEERGGTSPGSSSSHAIQRHAELKELGYKGSYGTIRDCVLPFREPGVAPPAVPGPPKALDLARWIPADPDNLPRARG
jgi:hypothetical protein